MATNLTLPEVGKNSTLSEEFEHVSMHSIILVTVCNIAVFCIGIYGNALVMLVILKMPSMRTVTNYYLFSMSAADLLVLTVCQPIAIMEIYTKDRWYLGEFMCKLVPLLENGMLHVSILTMISMTTERYYSIIYPFRNLSSSPETTTVKVIICLWIVAFICTSPFLLITSLEDAQFFDGSDVKVCRTQVHLTWHKVYVIVNIVMFFLLPFFILTYMYSRIIRTLMNDSISLTVRNDQSARITLRARKQVVRTLILIIILFFASMCPIRVVSLWIIFTPEENLQQLGIESYYNIMWFARIMMYINSAGNPVIYSLSSTKFKMAFRRIIRQYKPCALFSQSSPTTAKIVYRATKTRRANTDTARVTRNVVNEDGEIDSIEIHNRNPEALLVKIKICNRR